MSYKNNYLTPEKLSKTDIKNMKKHLLFLKNKSMFWWFPNLYLQIQFLAHAFPRYIQDPNGKFHFFLALLHLKHNVTKLSSPSVSQNTSVYFIQEPPRALIYLSLYLVVGSLLSFSSCSFFLPEDWGPSLHCCFNCSPLSRSIVW